MKNTPRYMTGAIQLIAVAIGASAIAYFSPPSLFKSSATTIGAFVGLTVAALIPAMMLAATTLSSQQQGINEFNALKKALSEQISFFSGLFLLAILLAVALVVGETVEWSFPTNLVKIGAAAEIEIEWGKIVNFSILLILILIVLRLFTFLGAVKSLFILHADDKEKDLKRRIKAENEMASKKINSMPQRNHFGASAEWPDGDDK